MPLYRKDKTKLQLKVLSLERFQIKVQVWVWIIFKTFLPVKIGLRQPQTSSLSFVSKASTKLLIIWSQNIKNWTKSFKTEPDFSILKFGKIDNLPHFALQKLSQLALFLRCRTRLLYASLILLYFAS